MMLLDLPGVAGDDVSVDELLEQLDPYIVALVRQKVYSTKIGDPPVSALEFDEIIQQTRIKLWSMLNSRRIENPKAYIRSIIHNIMIDMRRKQRPPLPLPVDEEGELYTGTVIVTPQEGMEDPANELEQEEAVAELLESTAAAVSSLPPRQRQAMICLLAERVDDTLQLVEAFKKYQVDVDVDWPVDKLEMQLLKASLSAARKKVGHSMGINQSGRDGADKAPAVQRHEPSPDDRNEPLALEQRKVALQGAGIEAYIDNLREPYRTVVRLHYVKKHTYPQIADELNLPTGTVKSQFSRGMKMLRKLREMGPALHEESEQGTDIAEIVARVGTLDEPYRTPVELHYVKKRTCQQIAGQLNLPKGTVKSQISRGMKMLRKSA